VKETGNLSIPLNLRNAPTSLMKELGYGKDYQYAHDGEDAFVHEEYLPDEVAGQAFYFPKSTGAEAKMAQRLSELWKEKYGY